MEPLLDMDVLHQIFQHSGRIGNVQQFSDSVSELHHRYLSQRLRTNSQIALPDLQELSSFAEKAEFLANEYTNPLVTDRIEGLPFDNIPGRRLVQDALAVAGTIFEYLGDIVSDQEKRFEYIPPGLLTTETTITGEIPAALKDMYEGIGRSGLLYLKSALCYGLGLYEPRTGAILRQLVENLQKNAQFLHQDLSLQNSHLWADYLMCTVLSRDLKQIVRAIPFAKHQVDILRQQLKQFTIQSNNFERISLRVIRQIETSLSLIDACFFCTEAFLYGHRENSDQALQRVINALKSVMSIGDYQREWAIRTFSTVIEKMWKDSPWVRLRAVISRPGYLRKLVEDGIVTLWSSQIAALEMKSNLGPLTGGYLDERVKRVVIHMPTSAGKTLLAQLAVAQQAFANKRGKCIYVGFSRALCDQVAAELAKRLALFGIRVTALASDNELLTETYESMLFEQATVFAVTPEKLNYMLRQHSTFLRDTTLFIFDELHNISKPDGRGWIYEELISLLLRHPHTSGAKMLFLSAVMPNHLMIQEWVDPDRLGETINHPWQPTRTLKGVIEFTGEKPKHSGVPGAIAETTWSGNLVYVRRREDTRSPLRIDGFISSKQVLEWFTPDPKPDEPSWKNNPYWKRVIQQSASDIYNAAEAAVRLERLGSVLIYSLSKADVVKLCNHLIAIYSTFPEKFDNEQLQETIEFVRERLPSRHPLIQALQCGVAFHHGDLPRDVRNEIEHAFQERWIRIMVATTTLAEGVNFPIKTLLLESHGAKSQRRPYELSMRDFKNIVGRAGRALYETEGQVIFLQSIENCPRTLNRSYTPYLDLDPDSSDLSIKSTLYNDNILDQLTSLVDAVDGGTLNEQDFLFSSKRLSSSSNGTEGEEEDHKIDSEQIVNKLQTFTLLLQDQGLVGEDEESFIQIFQGTFLGIQRPDAAQTVLGPFAHRSARAIRSQLSLDNQRLFAQTGLKVSTCQKLMKSVQTYWSEKNGSISSFLERSLGSDILYAIATIIYSLEDPEVNPQTMGKHFDHARFFVDWILDLDPRLAEHRHFFLIKDATLRAQKYVNYIRHTLEFRASWILGAFWLFSKLYVSTHYDIDLITTPLGKELVVLPAYAKFGVDSPASALFSTLGMSPAPLVRQLASLYARQSGLENRYNYPMILQWLLTLQSSDLVHNNFKPLHIRRINRVLGAIKSSHENMIGDSENKWEIGFWVAGWSYYDGKRVLSELQKGMPLTLKRERSNKINKDAVEVFTDNGAKLGYVPDELCSVVAEHIDRGPVSASISRLRPADLKDIVYVYCQVE